jgi:hypothetical protein
LIDSGWKILKKKHHERYKPPGRYGRKGKTSRKYGIEQEIPEEHVGYGKIPMNEFSESITRDRISQPSSLPTKQHGKSFEYGVRGFESLGPILLSVSCMILQVI